MRFDYPSLKSRATDPNSESVRNQIEPRVPSTKTWLLHNYMFHIDPPFETKRSWLSSLVFDVSKIGTFRY